MASHGVTIQASIRHIVATAIIVALLTSCTQGPTPTPTSAATPVPTAAPTAEPSAVPTPLAALVDHPMWTDPGDDSWFDIESAGPEGASEVAGRISEPGSPDRGRGFVRDLDSGTMTFIATPGGYPGIEHIGGLSATAVAGTLDPISPAASGEPARNPAFIDDRATGTVTVIQPPVGFEGFAIHGIAGGLAYGEMEHRSACCMEGAWFVAGSRAITIDLATGAIADVTPARWRAPGLAVVVTSADEDRLLLNVSSTDNPDTTADDADDAADGAFAGAAVVELASGVTTELALGADADAVVLLAGEYVSGRYALPRTQAFTVGIASGDVRPIPFGGGASAGYCRVASSGVRVFVCVEGTEYFKTRLLAYDPATGSRTEIPVVVRDGQEVDATAGGRGGLVAGVVTRLYSTVAAFAYDLSTNAMYPLDGTAGAAEIRPDMIAGRWILQSNGEHTWVLP